MRQVVSVRHRLHRTERLLDHRPQLPQIARHQGEPHRGAVRVDARVHVDAGPAPGRQGAGHQPGVGVHRPGPDLVRDHHEVGVLVECLLEQSALAVLVGQAEEVSDLVGEGGAVRVQTPEVAVLTDIPLLDPDPVVGDGGIVDELDPHHQGIAAGQPVAGVVVLAEAEPGAPAQGVQRRGVVPVRGQRGGVEVDPDHGLDRR